MVKKIIIFMAILVTQCFAQESKTLTFCGSSEGETVFRYFQVSTFIDSSNSIYYILIPNYIASNCKNVYKFHKDSEYLLRLYKVREPEGLKLQASPYESGIPFTDINNKYIYRDDKWLIDFYFLIDYHEIK